MVDHFDLGREVVGTCMNFVDRYLDRYIEIDLNGIGKSAFQLLAMTCLYLAVKIQEPKRFHLGVMAQLSRGSFTEAHFLDAEKKILSLLQWNVHPPSPYEFLFYFLRILHLSSNVQQDLNKIADQARYLIELSVI